MRTGMKAAFSSLAALICATSASAATLIVDGNGQLTGATGVDVGGTLFDVEFVDGFCATVFGGCDEQSDFAFSDQSTALLAAQALLDQVFVDGPQGNFDTQPNGIAGCGNFGRCAAVTPYELSGTTLKVVIADNFRFGNLDRAYPSQTIQNSQTGGASSEFVWATFTLTQAVPEPGTWLMMILGFGAIGSMMRRTQKRSLRTRVRYNCAFIADAAR